MNRYYRPKRKDDLVRHLTHEHPKDVVRAIDERRWTVAALTDLHDDIHRKRTTEEVALREAFQHIRSNGGTR